MNMNTDLDALEREAYRASYSDGTIDLFAGLSLLWIGAAWIWLPDVAGLAGILPAIFVTPMLSARKRFLERRVGYVKWRAPRRRWEQRNLWLLLGAGIAMLGLGVAVFLLSQGGTDGGESALNIGSGLMAWLLALLALGLAFLMSTWRMAGYAAVLGISGLAAMLADSNPGWPILISGIAISVSGAVLLGRFVREHPSRGAA